MSIYVYLVKLKNLTSGGCNIKRTKTKITVRHKYVLRLKFVLKRSLRITILA